MEKENVFFLGLLWVLLNFLLRVRNMFNLIFTCVTPLILHFALKFKFIFSSHFFCYNSFYFQCLLSQLLLMLTSSVYILKLLSLWYFPLLTQ